jgi:hypothetical protein
MPQGLEVYDPNGNLVIGVDSKLTRYIGDMTLANDDYNAHTVSSNGFTTGTPFYSIENKNFSTIPIRWEIFYDTYDTRNTNYFSWAAGIAVNTNKVAASFSGNTLTVQQSKYYTSKSYNVFKGCVVKYGVM